MLLGYLKLPPGRYMLLEKKILALREELEEREAAIQVAPQYLNSYQWSQFTRKTSSETSEQNLDWECLTAGWETRWEWWEGGGRRPAQGEEPANQVPAAPRKSLNFLPFQAAAALFSCPEQLNRTHCLSLACLLALTKLTIRVFTTLQSEPRDLWPLRHLIRQIFGRFSDFWKIFRFL